jgi:general secretion pathway protein L
MCCHGRTTWSWSPVAEAGERLMAMMSEIKVLFDEWIAAVVRAVNSGIGRYARRRRILLREDSDHIFTAKMISARKGPALPEVSFRFSQGRPNPPLPTEWVAAFRGSRVEALMTPGQVWFRSLDFPKQAVDFLDGMIRTQIDRLTPWTADEVVFGWSPPSANSHERVELTLAATSKQEIQPMVQLATGAGAASIAGFAELPAAGGTPAKIKVFDQPLRGTAGRAIGVPQMLRVILLSSGLAAAASLMAAAYIGSALESEQQQLARRISERRASLRLNPSAGGSALGLLARRKQTSPSSVVVLEALSQALPDSTYVTELRIEGDKVQLVGMTQDAPSLIRLMERSPQFARATFFAPTTRAQNDPGERFHIEAHITPSFGSGT